MKVFISKYALSEGIQEFDAETYVPWEVSSVGKTFEDIPAGQRMVSVKIKYGSQNFHGEGTEWHRTLAEAQVRADKLRLARIVSLKKQIKKLEVLSF